MVMEKHTVILEKDFVVIGGGLAGVCAAISAARHGLRVALCQDRSVLGGNSSSECRVWACGATAMGFNRYADETGIIIELLQENLRRNPDGNPHLWDALLLDRMRAHKGDSPRSRTADKYVAVELSDREIDEIESARPVQAEKVGGLFGLEALREAAARQQSAKYTKIDE